MWHNSIEIGEALVGASVVAVIIWLSEHRRNRISGSLLFGRRWGEKLLFGFMLVLLISVPQIAFRYLLEPYWSWSHFALHIGIVVLIWLLYLLCRRCLRRKERHDA